MSLIDRVKAFLAPEVKSASPAERDSFASIQESIHASLRGSDGAPRTDEARIRAAQCHPVAMACINRIAAAVASVPLGVDLGDGQLAYEHPVSERLQNPKSQGGAAGLFRQVAASLATCGRAYVHGVGSPIPNSPPAALYFLRPDRLHRRLTSDGQIAFYDYASPKGSVRLAPSTVCEIKVPWLSDDPAMALSAIDEEAHSNLTPAWDGLALYQGMSRLVRKILDNNGGMPGVLFWSSQTGEPMAPDQREEVRDFFQRFRAGGDRYGEMAFVDAAGGSLGYLKTVVDVGSLNVQESQIAAAREICAVFGVPILLLSIGQDATYANQAEARRYFWLDTVVPGYLTPICDALSAWFRVGIAADLNEVPALADYRNSQAQSIAAMDYLTINEKRAMVGKGPIMGGDILMTSPAMMPINRVLDANANNLSDETDGWVLNQERLVAALRAEQARLRGLAGPGGPGRAN